MDASSSNFQVGLVAGVAVGASAMAWNYLGKKNNLPYPPGPPPKPIIGNALDMPTDNHAEIYHKMSEQYGAYTTGTINLWGCDANHCVMVQEATWFTFPLSDNTSSFSVPTKLFMTSWNNSLR
jgi:hypothetical protein